MIIKLSILYIGSLDTRSNSFRRYQALCSLHSGTKVINTDPFILKKYFIRLQHHLNWGPGIFQLNKKVIANIAEKKYDIILVDNKSYLYTATLLAIKKKSPDTKIANLITDDPFGKYSKSWRLFKKTAALFDIVFVQREINITELKSIGVKKVELCYRSFDPEYNRPINLNENDLKLYGTKVGFVGSFEEARASFIAYIIQNGIPVTVTGAGWVDSLYWDIIKPYYKAPFVYGDDYIKALCGMDIALHFLRHANRDEQDSRTFEIPSAGVFMLAEKSKVHTTLFTENKEAVYFDTKEELLDKVKYYLINNDKRIGIAKSGLKRCIASGYSHRERLEKVVQQIINI